MLYSEIIEVCFETHTKQTVRQNIEFLNVKSGGTYSNHWALEDLICSSHLRPGLPLRFITKNL
jgi:hypothetical protein